MQAGWDAGCQSRGLHLIRQLDPAGLRTVGVLTKADAPRAPGEVAQHIANTLAAYPLENGYFATAVIASC